MMSPVSAQSSSDAQVGRVGLAPLIAVCTGYFMVILDVTIVNVAAPAIGRDLSITLTDLQWIVDGYTVAFAGLLLLGGALGDRWGHRRVVCLGVALFTVSSLGCAVAPTALTLTAFGPGAGLRAVGRDRGRGGHRGPARGRGPHHHGGVALGVRHQPARRCAVPRA